MAVPNLWRPSTRGGAVGVAGVAGDVRVSVDGGGVSPAAMAAMRIAATLAHVLPTLRLRVRHRQVTLVEVAGPASATGPALGSCAFRRAVAGAHEQAKAGVQLGFRGVPLGEEPAIDIAVQPGDATLPGGVYRVTLGDQTVHGFATTVPLHRCREVLEGLPDAGHLVRLHHDAATEVTFVHTVTANVDAPADAAHLAPALEALFADEVMRELVATR